MKEPEALWDKLEKMPRQEQDNRQTLGSRLTEKGSEATWKMIEAFDFSSLPTSMQPDVQRKTKDYDIVAYDSLRPQFQQMEVRIKGATDEGQISCGVHAMADALELLWSKKMGFPIKVDEKKLREIYDKQIGSHNGSTSKGTRISTLIEAVQKTGGFDALSESSRSKIQLKELPTLKAQDLTLPIAQTWAGKILPVKDPVIGLLIQELKKGHPILWGGHLPKVTSMEAKKEKMQARLPSDNPAYPYKSTAGSGQNESHTALITGYYSIAHSSFGAYDWKRTFWEVRNNWGSDYADQGYAWCPLQELKGTFNIFESLSLE